MTKTWTQAAIQTVFDTVENSMIPITERLNALKEALEQGFPINTRPAYDEVRRSPYRYDKEISGGETLLHAVSRLSVPHLDRSRVASGSAETDAAFVKILLDHGADQSVANEFRILPIQATVGISPCPAFDRLLENAKNITDPEKKSKVLDAALQSAVMQNALGRAEQIYQAGGRWTQQTMESVFSYEGRNVSPETLRFMKDHAADFHTRHPQTDEYLTHLVAAEGDAVKMQFLMDEGLPPDGHDKAGNTPAMVLASGCRMDKGEERITGKFHARSMGARGECALILKSAGADPRAKNHEGKYAIDYWDNETAGTKEVQQAFGVHPIARLADKVGGLLSGRKSGTLPPPPSAGSRPGAMPTPAP